MATYSPVGSTRPKPTRTASESLADDLRRSARNLRNGIERSQPIAYAQQGVAPKLGTTALGDIVKQDGDEAGFGITDPESMHVEPAAIQGLGRALEANRFAGFGDTSVDVEPVLFVIRNEFAHPFSRRFGKAGLTGKRGIDFEESIIRCLVGGVKRDLDNAEAGIQGVEQRAVSVVGQAARGFGRFSVPHLGFKLCPMGMLVLDYTAHFQLIHRQTREYLERQALVVGDALRARFAVEHTDGAERQAFLGLEQRAGVKPQSICRRHERIADKPFVQPGVGNDHGVILQDRMRAD